MFKQKTIFVILLLLLPACKPNTNERARDLILHYCDVTYKHYQPITFDAPLPYFVPYPRSSKTIAYNLDIKNLKQKKDSLAKLLVKHNKPAYLLQTDSVITALTGAEKTAALYKRNYKPARKGWMIVHAYNQRNVGGPMTRSTTVFIVDNDFKTILETFEN
jgi:hypothetical protein